MKLLEFSALAVLLVAVGYGYWRFQLWRKANLAASVQPRAFMTGNEIEFYHRLTRALPEFHVFPQVSMGALVQPNVPSSHPQYWQIRGTFSQKVCDYVVCSRDSLAPLFLVELDDKTHDFGKDAKRDDIVAHGALWTVRFWSRAKPSRSELRNQVSRVLGPRVGFTP